MKLFHLSDLHLGKRVHEFSMLEDQRYILNQIIGSADEHSPDAMIIAGDVFDKTVPSAEAMQLFDEFLCRLAQRSITVLIISGNHDSAERLSVGSHFFEKGGIHIPPVYDGKVSCITLTDNFGSVNFYLLPFIKPVQAKRFFPESEINSYTDAVAAALSAIELNVAERNILITHQFVTGAVRSDSEEISVGGADNVDAAVFEQFDYVALGHIHRPQNIIPQRIRYCGTPLKYSFSEAGNNNSITVVDIAAKGELSVSTLPLVPLRDMREIKGAYQTLTSRISYAETNCEDYIHAILTDEQSVPYAFDKLRAIYPNIMRLSYDNARTRSTAQLGELKDVERRSPLELFSDFYRTQNNSDLDDEQQSYLRALIEQVKEESL